MIKWFYNWLACPHRIAAVKRHFKRDNVKILDVGCGNHSPRITKRYLPACEYHGLADRRWNMDNDDDRCMDYIFTVDLEDESSINGIDCYDAVICSHVLEHLSDPYGVLSRLAAKVKPGGMFYIETPSERSLRLPRAAGGWFHVRGCLNFHDDETHKEIVDTGKAIDILQESGFVVIKTQRWILWRRVLLFPCYAVGALIVKRFIPASILWEVTGFLRIIIAVLPEASKETCGGAAACMEF